jgi:ATP-dependent Zn protease
VHEVSDQHLQTAADKTEGLAGAELENIVNLAALNSVRKAHSLK